MLFADFKKKYNPPQVRVKSKKKNFVPWLFILYCKLLCNCFKFLLKISHLQQHQIGRKENFDVHMNQLKVLHGEMKLMMKFYLRTFSLKFEIYFLEGKLFLV